MVILLSALRHRKSARPVIIPRAILKYAQRIIDIGKIGNTVECPASGRLYSRHDMCFGHAAMT